MTGYRDILLCPVFNMYMMKKTLWLLGVLMVVGLTAQAQTLFRPITFEQAVEAAQTEGKLVFVDFYTDWCGPCKVMSGSVFPQKELGDFMNERFVCLKLDAEKEGKELAKRFKVKAYPTYIILNKKEEVQFVFSGCKPADELMDDITLGLDSNMTPVRMEERYKAGERTPQLVYAYSLEKQRQGQREEALQMVNEYYFSLNDAQRVEFANSFIFIRYTKNYGDEKARFMIDHWNEFDPKVRKRIMSCISTLYHFKVYGYIYKPESYNEAEFQTIKKEITKLGLNEKGGYDEAFRLIEYRAKNDDNTFWTMCEKEFDKMSSYNQNQIMSHLGSLIPTNDSGLLKRMAQFIRVRLDGIDSNSKRYAERTLKQIESKLDNQPIQ